MKPITTLINITVLTILTSAPTLLQAAPVSPPQIDNAIRQIKPPRELSEPKSKSLIEIEGIKKPYRPEITDDKNSKKVLVKRFSLEGNTQIDSKLLLGLIAHYQNKALSFAEMKTVASIITKEYRKQGYIVARAYIPVQNMNNGVLDIVIIEGRYGAFNLKNNSKVNTFLIQSMLDTNQRGAVIQISSLGRSLLLVNDLPGVVISSANITPGKEVGSSDFLITTEDDKAYDGYILADNYGGRYTGKYRAMMGLNLYAPLNIGDQLSLFGLSSGKGDLTNGSVSYSVPMYKNGLRAEIGYSNTTYQLGREFSNLDARGDADRYYARLSYPVLKKRAENLNVFFRTENNFLTDKVGSTNLKVDKEILVFRAGADYQKTDLHFFDRDQKVKANVEFSYGDLDFKDAGQRAIDKAGVNTEGKFSKMTFQIKTQTELYEQLSLETSFNFQHALNGKNLDGSEDMSIGGAYGVKLFPSGELSAENAYIFNVEAKYPLPQLAGLSHSIGAFYDLGRADMEIPTSTFKPRTFQDVGVGYYANYKGFFAKAQAAWRVGNEHVTSEPNRDLRFLAMLGWSF